MRFNKNEELEPKLEEGIEDGGMMVVLGLFFNRTFLNMGRQTVDIVLLMLAAKKIETSFPHMLLI